MSRTIWGGSALLTVTAGLGLLLVCYGCPDRGDDDAAGDDDAGAEPHFPPCDPDASEQVVTFVHVNDIHGTYTPDPAAGGQSPVARMRGYYERVRREENPYTLFTDGGDDHEKGSVAEQLSDGMATVEVVRALQFDARVLGNHDFAWSSSEFLEASRDDHALVLTSNTTYDGPTPELWGGTEYAELQVGCVSIGMFGLVTGTYDECNEEAPGDFYPDGDFHTSYDHAATAAAIVDAHRDEVDLLVLVSHLGASADEALANEVAGIDIVLGGHSHTPIGNAENSSDALIIQAGSMADFIGRLDVTVDLASKQITGHDYKLLLNLPENVELEIDEELQATVEQIMATHAPEANETIATLQDGWGDHGVAAVIARAALATLPDVDTAVIAPDTVWDDWQDGPLTQQQLLDTIQVERQPAGTLGWTSIWLVDLDGADLQAVLDQMPTDWQRAGLDAPEPGQSYTLALQKCTAWNPDRFFTGVTFEDLREGDEAWAVLDAYGRQRTAECLYLDADEALPGCP